MFIDDGVISEPLWTKRVGCHECSYTVAFDCGLEPEALLCNLRVRNARIFSRLHRMALLQHKGRYVVVVNKLCYGRLRCSIHATATISSTLMSSTARAGRKTQPWMRFLRLKDERAFTLLPRIGQVGDRTSEHASRCKAPGHSVHLLDAGAVDSPRDGDTRQDSCTDSRKRQSPVNTPGMRTISSRALSTGRHLLPTTRVFSRKRTTSGRCCSSWC